MQDTRNRSGMDELFMALRLQWAHVYFIEQVLAQGCPSVYDLQQPS